MPVSELSTEPGKVMHAKSGRSLAYGELAEHAMDLPVPDPASVQLRDPSQFRWIGKPVKRVDAYDKSTGKALYSIDLKVDDMLHAAVQHAPRLGMTVGNLRNEEQVKAMKGVHSVHRLPGAVAVVAERWWHAKRAVEAIQVDWQEPTADSKVRPMPANFSSDAWLKRLADDKGPARDDENEGDVAAVLASAKTRIDATYHNQYLNHGQLEPPSALARFNPDGSLEVWLPNQAPDMFRADIAKRTGLDPSRITLHSPLLGGFFGRHFLYDAASPYPQAIELSKAVGRPVKLIWSREEEFLRDVLRPVAAVNFRAALDNDGWPLAIEAISATEGPTEALAGKQGEKLDPTALEGLSGKSYAIPNKRIAQIYAKGPAMLGYWRSVGNSLNDFFYESFLDELADKGGKDPFELRLHLLRDNQRLTTLLHAVGELSGGWKRGPFTAADGSKRARGVAMASPFGTQTAVIAEVSIEHGQVKVHDIWQAIDPEASSIRRLSKRRSTARWRWACRRPWWRKPCGLMANRARATTTCIRSCRLRGWPGFTCVWSRAGKNGRYRRTTTARRRARRRQCRGNADRATGAQPAHEPPHLHLISAGASMNNSRFARTAGWLAVPCLVAAGLLAWYVTREPVSRLENNHTAVADIDPALVARGEYVARLSDCVACHSVPGGAPFAGGLEMATPLGAIHATNITPEPETGIGRYSLADLTVQYATAWHPTAAVCTRRCPTRPTPSSVTTTCERCTRFS